MKTHVKLVLSLGALAIIAAAAFVFLRGQATYIDRYFGKLEIGGVAYDVEFDEVFFGKEAGLDGAPSITRQAHLVPVGADRNSGIWANDFHYNGDGKWDVVMNCPDQNRRVCNSMFRTDNGWEFKSQDDERKPLDLKDIPFLITALDSAVKVVYHKSNRQRSQAHEMTDVAAR